MWSINQYHHITCKIVRNVDSGVTWLNQNLHLNIISGDFFVHESMTSVVVE